jgi:predicted nucleotide-binding protein (sugar kinase/HSP70/actin superfamily)
VSVIAACRHFHGQFGSILLVGGEKFGFIGFDIDARLLEESQEAIQKSLRRNTGQCIPLNIIAQEFIDYLKSHDLDPSKTALWMVSSALSCNIGLYPQHLKRLIHSYGRGFEKADIYVGTMSFSDISMRSPINTYFAYMFGGLIKKIGCKIRPYKKYSGTTDGVIARSLDILCDAFMGIRSKERAVAEVVSLFECIETDHSNRIERPKVAIFGDLYARDNEMMNQNLIHFVEDHGGRSSNNALHLLCQNDCQTLFKKMPC